MYLPQKNPFRNGLFSDQDCYNLVYNNRTTTSTTVQTDMYIAKSITKTHSNSDALKMDILYGFDIPFNNLQTAL